MKKLFLLKLIFCLNITASASSLECAKSADEAERLGIPVPVGIWATYEPIFDGVFSMKFESADNEIQLTVKLGLATFRNQDSITFCKDGEKFAYIDEDGLSRSYDWRSGLNVLRVSDEVGSIDEALGLDALYKLNPIERW